MPKNRINILLYITVACFTSSCAQLLPARAKEISDGVFEVSATGNSFASFESLQKKAHKKSIKICKDKEVINIMPGKMNTGSSTVYTQGTQQKNYYFTYIQTIKCK